MGRGQTAEIGATRVAKNGYHYTKTDDRGWVLTHWLTMEAHLGRKLEENESVRFKEPRFKREPENPEGLVLIRKKTSSLRKRKAVIEARIEELQAELQNINEKLERL